MERKKIFNKRLFIPLLVVLAVLVIALALVPTLARYIRGTGDAPNEFGSIGSKDPEVIIEEKDGTMNSVKFKVGMTEYPVYVRVEVVITWKKTVTNEDGSISESTLHLRPLTDQNNEDDNDYTVEYNEHDWVNVGDYWYYIGTSENESHKDDSDKYISYNGIVRSNETTKTLINKFEPINKSLEAPFDDYELDIEFIVQTIQAVGKTDDDKFTACEDAWGVTRIEENNKWTWKAVNKSEGTTDPTGPTDDNNNAGSGGSDDNNGGSETEGGGAGDTTTDGNG